MTEDSLDGERLDALYKLQIESFALRTAINIRIIELSTPKFIIPARIAKLLAKLAFINMLGIFFAIAIDFHYLKEGMVVFAMVCVVAPLVDITYNMGRFPVAKIYIRKYKKLIEEIDVNINKVERMIDEELGVE